MQGPIEFQTGFISYSDEKFFFVQMKDESISTIETVKISHEIMTEMQPNGPVFLLVDSGKRSTSEDDIFEYLQTTEFNKRVVAHAVIVNDLPTRLMGNLFLRFIKNQRHIKIFNKHAQAKDWLIEQMNRHSDDSNSKTKKSFMFV